MTGLKPANCHHRAASMAALVLILCTPPALAPADALPQDRALGAAHEQSIDAHITEAAQRFGIPEHWIRAVIEFESAGDPRAVSGVGAMGLMQIMPTTWAELRASFGLGDDPFAPRENILAGTAYLRQMYDRFGSPGFLAAYNAGPTRYKDHLETGRPLPRETRSYLAALAPIIGNGPVTERTVDCARTTPDWREAALFAAMKEDARVECDVAPSMASEAARNDIFVPLSQEQRR